MTTDTMTVDRREEFIAELEQEWIRYYAEQYPQEPLRLERLREAILHQIEGGNAVV